VAPDDDLFEAQKIPIRVLEPEQATKFLQALLVKRHEVKIQQATLEPVVRAISRTPLALSLAAQEIAQKGVEQIPKPGFVAWLLHLADDAELYSRVLGHIDACALLFAACRAYEALGHLGSALDSLVRAEVEARRSGEADWLLRLEATRARIAPGHGGHSQGELTGERQAIEGLKASGVIDRLAGAALREVAAAFGHVDSALVRTALYRLGLPELTQAMISQLANMLADKARASPEKFKVCQSVLAPLHDGTLPKNESDPDEWWRWILEVPKVRLGQALAELAGQGSKLLPGLLDWAQSALQGRVERDRSGMGGSVGLPCSMRKQCSHRIGYAMLIKIYGNSPEAETLHAISVRARTCGSGRSAT
jgi:hypothetical protein